VSGNRGFYPSETGNRELPGWTVHRSTVEVHTGGTYT
jgi:hypothetical protein